MEDVQQGSNGTDLQTTTITASQFSQIAQQMSLAGGGSVAVVQLPGGQFQVQGVIQSAQSSVIQSPQMQTAQALDSDSDDSQDSSDSGAATHKTREILARRPSYRKILNELSSEEVSHGDGKDNQISTGVTVPTSQIYQTSTGQYITISANGTIQLATSGSEGIQGLQTVTMANTGAQQGTTILQYAQTPDGQQILVPSNQVVVQGAGGEVQTYQIRTAPSSGSMPQTVVMTSPMGISQGKSDDPTMKREIRLAKNRVSFIEVSRRNKRSTLTREPRHVVAGVQLQFAISVVFTRKNKFTFEDSELLFVFVV
ncbi:cyclic AMP-dependent transcription factor ATF-1 isoform X1 [Cottoperca gobio]|uniref:Cyclic AMP-dependent transcription factor ATF-1-like isoform X1 n=1 Tax=Cottoperca gobio TaxID=56716 RepID=A0A6J2PSQ7_COTGO|nr:cyclic AMP-dependent transcription factor ATF-1-like isoform X1 [Cottoperca gobio]XP_029288348.1 cyclic AMP-dependent transcription factor ATF-1-like isoform X1 [Cottoperca gobio]XP_029288349.1 cyclic AMP-dependent transcription factor ATF-1-like isoform X1 [Cottoperca gobio]XP_029288350.1 cyclic AMP-dependent transcription factor ATF-1-like isoform X1 [Cottoperca gobio]XP_029288351.1 cyclic AMP-dependent transcription factor ATF-1-like isoform X1 [Cottoperca gobio]